MNCIRAMITFTLTRPVIYKEYNAADDVIDVEEDVKLTDKQIADLFAQFTPFIQGNREDTKVVGVNIKDGNIFVTYSSANPITHYELDVLEDEFDAWFVDDGAPTWLYDLIPHKRWMMLGYRPLEN